MTAKYGWGDQKSNSIEDLNPNVLMGPYTKLVPLPTDGTSFPATRAVFADSNTTADVTDASGNVVEGFPLFQVETKVSITKIANRSNASANLWGAY